MALMALVVLLGAVVTAARRADSQASLVASKREGHMDAAFEVEEILTAFKANGSVPVGHVDASAKDLEVQPSHVDVVAKRAEAPHESLAASERDGHMDVGHVDASAKDLQVPPAAEGQEAPQSAAVNPRYSTQPVLALIYGVIYYALVVVNYPKQLSSDPKPAAVRLQEENAFSAVFSVSGANACLSFCCFGPRSAHTFHITGVLNYWVGLVLMTFLPCITLFVVNSCTDLNVKLGGQKQNCVMAMLCSCFCWCCLVAQDAESLDLMTGAKTGICAVTLPDNTAES